MLQKFDPRNKNIKVWIDGALYKREDAKISVFDSLSQGGDAVWEGLRVYDGRIFSLDEHLNRLMESAKSLAFEKIPSIAFIKDAIFTTLKANKMYDETHIRLTLTRGKKITSGMNPQLNQFGCTLIILAEWKPAIYSGKKLKLVTSNIRRNSPLCLDSKIHHNNLLNNILAKIEANRAKADDALMLDYRGYVAEGTGANIFFIKDNDIHTPIPDCFLNGITRQAVIKMATEQGFQITVRHILPDEIKNYDEAFLTGTAAEITPIRSIDNINFTTGDNTTTFKFMSDFSELVNSTN